MMMMMMMTQDVGTKFQNSPKLVPVGEEDLVIAEIRHSRDDIETSCPSVNIIRNTYNRRRRLQKETQPTTQQILLSLSYYDTNLMTYKLILMSYCDIDEQQQQQQIILLL